MFQLVITSWAISPVVRSAEKQEHEPIYSPRAPTCHCSSRVFLSSTYAPEHIIISPAHHLFYFCANKWSLSLGSAGTWASDSHVLIISPRASSLRRHHHRHSQCHCGSHLDRPSGDHRSPSRACSPRRQPQKSILESNGAFTILLSYPFTALLCATAKHHSRHFSHPSSCHHHPKLHRWPLFPFRRSTSPFDASFATSKARPSHCASLPCHESLTGRAHLSVCQIYF